MKNIQLPPDIKLLAPYLGALILIIAVAIFTYRISVKEIMSQSQKVKTASEELVILQEKEATLQSIKDDILTSADSSLAAVPETNSSLIALTQIKALASAKGIAISNLLIASSQGADDIKDAHISFDLDGPLASIVDFGVGLKDLAPLMSVIKIATQNSQSSAKANMIVASYWSDLPKNIGSLTEPLGDLDEEEQKLLQRFMSLGKPSFSALQPEGPTQRPDPFN